MPSALQFIVTGSLRGTVVSIGCSTMRGTWKAAMKWNKREEDSSVVCFPCFYLVCNFVSNLIKLKVLLSVFQHFLLLLFRPFVRFSPQSNYGFSASPVAKPTKHQMALNIKNGFQLRSASFTSFNKKKKERKQKKILKFNCTTRQHLTLISSWRWNCAAFVPFQRRAMENVISFFTLLIRAFRLWRE